MRTTKDLEEVEPGDLESDLETSKDLKTATFSVGCFWGPDALFGAQKGVFRTRVGYTGGEKEHPTYRSLGDHTETVQVDYDPEGISYRELLSIFWDNHNASRKRKKQYASRIFYHSEQQKELAEATISEQDGEVETEILPADTFWVAEDYHQKYRLRQHPDLMEEFSDYRPEKFINSTVAARLNAIVAGNFPDFIKEEISRYGLSANSREKIEKMF